MTITETNHDLHILFFPIMAQGHMIPILDMARLFSARGVRVTVVTTPLNAPLFTKTLTNSDIALRIVEFPSRQAGLPDGLENLDMVTAPDQAPRFFQALSLLEPQLDEVLSDLKPHALVADVFFMWAPDLAAKHAIPWIGFHGTGFMPMCCMHSLMKYRPFDGLSPDDEQEFVVPGLPDEIRMTMSRLPENMRLGTEDEFTKMLRRVSEAASRSYGMIVNSFRELEPAYADHYRNVVGKRAWHVGPVSLCNEGSGEKARRGKEAAITERDCLSWLGSKRPGSVIYVCFGSNVSFGGPQLEEIAAGLEASGKDFVWAVRKGGDLPEGFEERVRGRGLVIRGWAPQVLILDHEAVGGFVTHCGWNSVLEGVSAGVAMVTWPIFAEQFYNEKLVTEVVRTGVAVGAKKWERFVGDFVGRGQVERGLNEVLGSEEMRLRARALAHLARAAVQEGGSSHSDLGNLIRDLKEAAGLTKQD